MSPALLDTALPRRPLAPSGLDDPSAEPVVALTVPFSLADDSAVTWAVEQFDATGAAALRVIHPDPRRVAETDLAELRVRFAHRLRGRFVVSCGSPTALHIERV